MRSSHRRIARSLLDRASHPEESLINYDRSHRSSIRSVEMPVAAFFKLTPINFRAVISPSANSSRNNLGDVTASRRRLQDRSITCFTHPRVKHVKSRTALISMALRIARFVRVERSRSRTSTKSKKRRSSYLKVFAKDDARSWRVRMLQRSSWAICRILERERKQAAMKESNRRSPRRIERNGKGSKWMHRESRERSSVRDRFMFYTAERREKGKSNRRIAQRRGAVERISPH